MAETPTPAEAPRLRRRLGVLEATALNMANMVGVGPFLTIPLIVALLPGPQVMAAWACGLLVALADSMVWCELGAALPGSGGTYHYLREVFRPFRLGRILPFLFIWQFLFSGPLEVATGCIGLVSYLNVLWPSGWPPLSDPGGALKLTVAGKTVATVVAGLAVALLYRRIGSIGKLTVLLWAGMLVTITLVIVSAALHFDPGRAFSLPSGAFRMDREFAIAFGGALGIAMYDFLGYYDICYLGDEVREPARTIPRAVVISVISVAAIYTVMNVGIMGVLPVEEVIASSTIFTRLVETVWGTGWGRIFTVLIIWTAFASVFALLLGYSRIPYAAARDGYFFSPFADLHPTKDFPRLSLAALGLVTASACWFDFGDVLTALLTSRILVQFVAQIAAVVVARRMRPDIHLPFRMWLYPLPCLVALCGWLYVFGASGRKAILYGLVTLSLGIVAFFIFFRPRQVS